MSYPTEPATIEILSLIPHRGEAQKIKSLVQTYEAGARIWADIADPLTHKTLARPRNEFEAMRDLVVTCQHCHLPCVCLVIQMEETSRGLPGTLCAQRITQGRGAWLVAHANLTSLKEEAMT